MSQLLQIIHRRQAPSHHPLRAEKILSIDPTTRPVNQNGPQHIQQRYLLIIPEMFQFLPAPRLLHHHLKACFKTRITTDKMVPPIRSDEFVLSEEVPSKLPVPRIPPLIRQPSKDIHPVLAQRIIIGKKPVPNNDSLPPKNSHITQASTQISTGKPSCLTAKCASGGVTGSGAWQ